jgi:hypothetical protein
MTVQRARARTHHFPASFDGAFTKQGCASPATHCPASARAYRPYGFESVMGTKQDAYRSHAPTVVPTTPVTMSAYNP